MFSKVGESAEFIPINGQNNKITNSNPVFIKRSSNVTIGMMFQMGGADFKAAMIIGQRFLFTRFVTEEALQVIWMQNGWTICSNHLQR